MVSGRATSLFPETLRNFNFCNNPIESGSISKRLDAALSSSRFSSPAMESGMNCYFTQKLIRDSNKPSKLFSVHCDKLFMQYLIFFLIKKEEEEEEMIQREVLC